MLTDLHVRDLGVIRDVTISLGPGMTALTGETGAGKTLLVQALQLVLGGRAAPGLVRAGADEAAVEARFARGGDLETVLARSLPAGGRSRAWIDGRMVPVAALEEAGTGLVDIHGQHDQQSLLSAAGQRAALDLLAGADAGPLTAARQELAEIERRLARLGGDARDRARQLDLLRYQIEEIEDARIEDPAEDALLQTEEERLADASSLRELAARAAVALDGDEGGSELPSATSLVRDALGALGGRGAFGPLESRLRGLLAEVADAASGLREAAETWEDDPARLEAVQARRRLLADLRRKYGETLEEVVAFAQAARRELAHLEGQELEAATLETALVDAGRLVAERERALRKVRADAAPRLAASVTERLRRIDMADARFEVTVGEEGAGDAVQFLLAANRGEPTQPLTRVASGGELSRTMLALRLVVEGGAPTMLFDEVDAGVGGAAAVALARALHEVARRRQVLVVTHLPQVAASADRQLAVSKSVSEDGRTVTLVEEVDGEARVVELSRMLSGHPDSATARAHAEELLAARTAEVERGGARPARGRASTIRAGRRD